MSTAEKPASKVSFLVFFLLWAKRQRWVVPDEHVRACHWLEHRADLAAFLCHRGFGKSTLLAIYNAWRFYLDPTYRILHQSEADGTAYKTSRDTQHVLRHHPLTRGLLPEGQGSVEQFWVSGSTDPRNASMYAKGILSNVTSARADECQNDDVEVPRNIGNPEAREKLRYRLEEQTHILVPGGRQLYIGTPHTHDSIYDDARALGADVLEIRMFGQEHRIEKAAEARYVLPFAPEVVFEGIGKHARLLREGADYRLEGTVMVLAKPAGAVVDCYADVAWPARFTPEELLKRRRKTRTLNGWDSQYQLHSKPVTQTRLDPDRMTPYDCPAVLRFVNGGVALWLGGVQIVGATLRWDPASGKRNSDVSALVLVLQDEVGRRYVHRAAALEGEVATTDEDGKKIIGGQVVTICDWVEEFQLPRLVIETNGIGNFAPAVVKTALKQRRLACGVTEQHTSTNKNLRILESLEPLLLSRDQIWAHVDVLDGPLYDEMREWKATATEQADDFCDATAGACSEMPERIGKIVGGVVVKDRQDWRTNGGVHEVGFERSARK